MTGKQDVSIVIPTWNGRALLAEFLPSVIAAAQRYRDLYRRQVEIIVVDDASSDDSVAWLKSNYPESVRVVARAQNGGFACAVNSGFAAATHAIVLLLNNDILVEAEAIAPLVDHFAKPEVFAVCCKAYRLGSDLFDGAGKLGDFHKGHWRNYLSYDILPTLHNGREPLYSFVASGGYAAFDVAKFRALGGFCELLSPFYWEDTEICYRAWKRGWVILYEPASIVHHKSSATIGNKFPSRHVRVISERNRLITHWINLHDQVWLGTHLFWVFLKMLGAIFVFDFIIWRAFFAAITRLPEILVRRRIEKHASQRSDREIAGIFKAFNDLEWAYVIRNPQDYYQYLGLKNKLGIEKAVTSQERDLV